ncbi:Hypothetical predicted protein [Cloeon dipterum]|uniref:Uncharacterized protein n=1 Tax=Cloeon dipterum TaxID=197152 RepID=A0A8S1E2E3_9INSE|nr:Hypothetical predicted protein [Cloeon dipterum]
MEEHAAFLCCRTEQKAFGSLPSSNNRVVRASQPLNRTDIEGSRRILTQRCLCIIPQCTAQRKSGKLIHILPFLVRVTRIPLRIIKKDPSVNSAISEKTGGKPSSK